MQKNTKLPHVTVLLSTFNGAAFLSQQLDSLAVQTGVRWSLNWRDDGSTDDTVCLLDRFGEAMGRPDVRRASGSGEHLGPGRSFLSLLAHAGDEGLFAFCDQDDVWLERKLQRAALALDAVPSGEPAIYCSRQILVNERLDRLGLSPRLRHDPGFRNALAQNVVTGCTLVMNAAAREAVVAAGPLPHGSFHDWWTYLVVTGCGGRVLFDSEPSVLYRQHQGNVVGAPNSIFTRAAAALDRGPQPFMAMLARHLDGLRLCATRLTPEAWEAICICRDLWSPRLATRLSALYRSNLYRQSLPENLGLWAWVGLIGRAQVHAAARPRMHEALYPTRVEGQGH